MLPILKGWPSQIKRASLKSNPEVIALNFPSVYMGMIEVSLNGRAQIPNQAGIRLERI